MRRPRAVSFGNSSDIGDPVVWHDRAGGANAIGSRSGAHLRGHMRMRSWTSSLHRALPEDLHYVSKQSRPPCELTGQLTVALLVHPAQEDRPSGNHQRSQEYWMCRTGAKRPSKASAVRTPVPVMMKTMELPEAHPDRLTISCMTLVRSGVC